MVVRLAIFGNDWIKEEGKGWNMVKHPEDAGEIIARKAFRSYTDLADWLDDHPEYKNKVMVVNFPNKLGRNVVFDKGVWVEDYGNV